MSGSVPRPFHALSLPRARSRALPRARLTATWKHLLEHGAGVPVVPGSAEGAPGPCEVTHGPERGQGGSAHRQSQPSPGSPDCDKHASQSRTQGRMTEPDLLFETLPWLRCTFATVSTPAQGAGQHSCSRRRLPPPGSAAQGGAGLSGTELRCPLRSSSRQFAGTAGTEWTSSTNGLPPRRRAQASQSPVRRRLPPPVPPASRGCGHGGRRPRQQAVRTPATFHCRVRASAPAYAPPCMGPHFHGARGLILNKVSGNVLFASEA